MNAPRIIPDVLRHDQTRASDPQHSAWVAANAGAGKTHVLAQRVIRLLLSGVEPGRILCITFTTAAAANMANRVFNELRKWTVLDDAALDQAMRAIGVRSIDTELRNRARRLFALALETPGGLKVQTIHAFCTHLLHLFPFEANVAARFTVLDDAQQRQLLSDTTLAVLLEAAATPEGALGKALNDAITAAADMTFRDMVGEAIDERDRLDAWIAAAGGVPAAIEQLSRTLGIDPADSAAKVTSEFFDASLIAASEWSAVAAALAQGLKTDNEHAARFTALSQLAGEERIKTYQQIFCTAELSPRKNIVTKAIRDDNPALFQRLMAEQHRVCELIGRRRAVAVRDRTAALVTIAEAVLRRYRAEKDRRGLLDYDDLIDKTLALLGAVSSAWVHYKLDRGIDHVLIDEAQDTSPKQWAIVRALVDEFFAGAGARAVRRTIFAVGDEKQSIFSFQGAVPREFDEKRREFDRLSKAAGHDMQHVRFGHSFRSGPNVLAAVDQVFAPKDIFASVTSDEGGVSPHIALPDAAPGVVEIWDTEKPAERREIEGWDAPFDELTETSPVARLATRIAKSVAKWQRQGIAARDVLVLVRRRGALFEAVIRALKHEGVAVAGADRLVLTEHIAVMDLMALADAVLLPDDDLALATVLKSPLFGLDDDALFELAWNRGKASLRSVVRQKRPELADEIDAIAKAAREQTPFAFYAQLLGAGGGRKKILSRLGHEAVDALDEFLNLALDYERGETPSLQGFVAWLRQAKSEVKRDMEMARDEVRVMTVHGAKGLEARVVILADSTTTPRHPPRLLALPAPNAAPGAPAHLVWAGSQKSDIGAMGDAREAARAEEENEYRRLLYVAMTRAIDRLIVCGAEGEKKRSTGCWYDLVFDALKADAVTEPADDGSGDVLRYRKTPEIAATQTPAPTDAAEFALLPRWLTENVRPEPARVVPIAPSSFGDNRKVADRAIERQHALLRGTLVHRLMQSLPEVAPEHRNDAARQYLARAGRDLTDTDRDTIARRTLELLADPRFAALFAPGSRAEVPIIGRVNGRPVNGVVDRLVVTAGAVLIADFKTNRPAPRSLDDAANRHPGYVAQLALYRAVLARLYPGQEVRAALLWTDTPDLMEIPAIRLDAALAGLTSP